uniref:Uncharacterized protein n=1 Tax=Cucumis melo TaxID=3656 RepID=A0A9I9EBA4_CUCME
MCQKKTEAEPSQPNAEPSQLEPTKLNCTDRKRSMQVVQKSTRAMPSSVSTNLITDESSKLFSDNIQATKGEACYKQWRIDMNEGYRNSHVLHLKKQNNQRAGDKEIESLKYEIKVIGLKVK